MRKPGEADWKRVAGTYAEEAAKRDRFNSEKFTVLADFRTGLPAGWTGDGWGYRAGRAKDGDFSVATEGGDALNGVFPAGIFTNLLSDRLNGVLRSPLLPSM